MFEIQVWHLLTSYSGDSETLEFEGEVLPGLYDDLVFLSSLRFQLTLITLDDGIEVVLRDFECQVKYEGAKYNVEIPEVSRTFKLEHDPLAPDDIGFIDKKHSTIDLKNAIREEIIMACESI